MKPWLRQCASARLATAGGFPALRVNAGWRRFVNAAQVRHHILTRLAGRHYSEALEPRRIGGETMATTRAMLERRRFARVFIRIPVQLFSNTLDGEPLVTLAEAIAVSRCGALVRAPIEPALGSRVEVLNGVSQEVQEFRVIRVNNSKDQGVFELGLEMLYPTRNFWGIQFPDDRLPVPA